MNLRPSLLLFALPSLAAADVRLPALFTDHMVLQRETAVRVWGWADPGETVQVSGSWLDGTVQAAAGEDGRWSVRIETPEAGGPHNLVVHGSNRLELKDVWSGEVWVCSGQSNMDWHVSWSGEPEAVIAGADAPGLRLFDVKDAISRTPKEDVVGTWQVCSPETVAEFSAVAYHFGRALNAGLEGVPIGLISSNWGGTVAESWTSAQGLAGFEEFQPVLARVAEEAQGGEVERTLGERQAEWWAGLRAVDPGFAAGWAQGPLGDGWSEVSVPMDFGDLGLEQFDGVVWLRREVELGEAYAGQELVIELGPVDDMDLTFWDGEPLGATQGLGKWRSPRRYVLDAARATAGTHVLCVAAVDTSGAGSLGRAAGEEAPMRLLLAEDRPAIDLTGTWHGRAGAPMGKLGAYPNRSWFNHNTPTALSNGMIAPLVPFTLRGAIWYQGESNRTRANQYRSLFPAMIADWRQRWDLGAFPFYYVQIAPFGYRDDTGQAAELREAQALTLSVPNTGMVVTMDVGNPTNIHPKDKVTVGRRLAALALKHDYGQSELRASGPAYQEMVVEEQVVRLVFGNAQGGLFTRDGEAPSHFTIAGKDGVFHPANARIDGLSVVVESDLVARPLAVRYAWGAADQPNLCGAGPEFLPVSSFRTDQ